MSTPICLLGAGGVIATHTARALQAAGLAVRLVSRNPKPVAPGDEVRQADLRDADAVRKALAGCSSVALVAGLPYRTAVWQRDWPVVMRNTIAACQAEGASLLFFDNVYAYGAVDGLMTETTPLRPSSRKGQVRAELVRMLEDAQQRGLSVTIARAPDFYGPKGTNSVPNVLVFDALAQGKSPSVLLRPEVEHTLIYAPDAGRATAQLLQRPDAWNQTWHLPVDPTPLTQGAFADLAAQHFGRPAGHKVLALWMLRLAAVASADIRESLEMRYQNDRPYRFADAKFRSFFPEFAVTPYAEGLTEVVASYR